MSNYCVYKHENKLNGKVYIGMTNNTKRRWRSSGIEYRPPKDRNQNIPFWNAIKKYGWDNFESSVLEDNLTFEQAIEMEIKYISQYQSNSKMNGYNVSKGGNGGVIYKVHPRGMKGKRQTKFQRKNHKLWASNKENNCMTNGKVIWGVTHPHPRGMKGKTHSEKTKESLRKYSGKNSSSAKSVKATLPTGEIKIFHTVKECSDYFDLCSTSSMFIRLLKTGEPYKMRPNTSVRIEHFKSLEGLKLEYIQKTPR